MSQERLSDFPARSVPVDFLVRRIESDAQRERNQSLDIFVVAKRSFKNGTSLANRIIKTNFDQSKYQRQAAQLTPEELQAKRKRQVAALKGSITRAIHLTERQQKGEQLTYNEQKATSKTLCLIESAIVDQPYNSREFDRQYKLTFPRPENEPPPSFHRPKPLETKPSLASTPEPTKPELPQPRPTVKATGQTEHRPTDLSTPTFLKEHQSTCQWILQNIAAIDHKLAKAEGSIRKNSHLYTKPVTLDSAEAHSRFGQRQSRLIPDKDRYQQALDKARATVNLNPEKRHVALALLELCPVDNQLIINQNSTVKPLTNAERFKIFLLGQKGQSVDRLPAAVWANFQQGNNLFDDLFQLDNTNPNHVHLVFNRAAAEKFLAGHYNPRRQLLATSAVLGTALAVAIAAETPPIKRILNRAKKDIAVPLDRLQAEFRSWWQNWLAQLWRPGEKVAIPGEWLQAYSEPFFRLGETALNDLASDLHRYFVERLGLSLPGSEVDLLQSRLEADLPFKDIPPQFVGDYLDSRNLSRLTQGLIDLYGDGYLLFCQAHPLLMKDIYSKCRQLARNISTFLKQSALPQDRRIDTLNPDYRVSQVLLTDRDIAEQLVHYALQQGKLTQLCQWQINKTDKTRIVDEIWLSHLEYFAWRGFERAHFSASSPNQSLLEGPSIYVSQSIPAETLLRQFFLDNFPRLKQLDSQYASKLANWFWQQPGALALRRGDNHLNDFTQLRAGDRLTIHPLWLGIIDHFLTEHIKNRLPLEMVFTFIDTRQLGEKGLDSNRPQMLTPESVQISPPSPQSPYSGVVETVKEAALAGDYNLPEIVREWQEDFITAVETKTRKLFQLDRGIPFSTLYCDAQGKLLHAEHPQGNIHFPTELNRLPPHLIDALIVAEDKNFYFHPGFDPRALPRIGLNGEVGGSGLTLQLVKMLTQTPQDWQAELSNPDLRLPRKETDIIAALIFEKELTKRYRSQEEAKRQILRLYLDHAFFGRHAYGIEAASIQFYGKGVNQLTLDESACLVGLIQQPSLFSTHPEKALEKRNYVLDRLVAEGKLTLSSAEQLKNKPLDWVKETTPLPANPVPHFTLRVRRWLEDLVPEKQITGTIHTTLNLSLQQHSQNLLASTLKESPHNIHQGSIVVTQNGRILTWVANSYPWSDPEDHGQQVDCCDALSRSTGSTPKPIAALSVIVHGGDGSTSFSGQPVTLSDDLPPFRNYRSVYEDTRSISEILLRSLNAQSIRVLVREGISRFLHTCHRLSPRLFTNTPPNQIFPNIVLGQNLATAADLTLAFGTLASQGRQSVPCFVSQIDGRPIISPSQQTLDPTTVKILTDCLPSHIVKGKNGRIYTLHYKTGTSDGPRDYRVEAYTDNGIAIGIWLGNLDNTILSDKVDSPDVTLPLLDEIIQGLIAQGYLT